MPIIQILDIPVPQMVEQLLDVLRFFASLLPIPEQVISAQDLLDDVPLHCFAQYAAGGTAGGSADDRILSSLQRTVE